MKNKKFRTFFKIIRPFLAIFIMFAVSTVCVKAFPNFFEKLTVYSALAQSPKQSAEVVLERFFDKKEEESIEVTVPPKEEQTSSQSTSSSEVQVIAPQGSGKISEYAIAPSKTSSKIIWHNSAAFSNTSNVSNTEILKILKQNPTIKLTKGKPQVLIYHTHATESYELKDLGYYESGSSARTQDKALNMVRVGDEIAKALEEAGIEVIHDTGLYDYPSYNGAYNRSAAKVNEYLKKYPSITVTLDIHRDAIENSGTRVKPTATINGKKAAQVMIIAGVDDGTMNFPNWRENMKFASSLQQEMEEKYAGLTRSVMVCHRRYNMYLTNNSLLIEVGGHANTLDEAIYSGEMIGKSLIGVLKEHGTK